MTAMELDARRMELIRKIMETDLSLIHIQMCIRDRLITWGAANDGAEKCVLTYTDATGQQQVREVLATVLEDIIQNVQSGSSFTYYTIYKPAANSPDSFNTKEDSRDFPE